MTVPSSAPAAAPAYAPAPSYYYYYPVAYAPAAPQAAPQSSLGSLGQIREILDFIKAIREIRDEVLPGTKVDPGTQPVTKPAEQGDIQSVLSRLEAGQADLRGRLINNAGTARAIGEKLVDVGEGVKRLEGRQDRQAEILSKLDQVLSRLPPAPPPPAPAPAPAPAVPAPGDAAAAPFVPYRGPIALPAATSDASATFLPYGGSIVASGTGSANTVAR